MFHTAYGAVGAVAEKTYNPASMNIGTLTAAYNVTNGTDNLWGNGHQEWAYNNNVGEGIPLIAVFDQFGRVMAADADVNAIFEISNIVENVGTFAHKSGSFKAVDSGTDTPSIEGAEIGDTFTITAKIEGTALKASLKAVVGADTSANMVNGTDNDKTFRTTKLGYDR